MDAYDPHELRALSTAELQALRAEHAHMVRRLARRCLLILPHVGLGLLCGCAAFVLAVRGSFTLGAVVSAVGVGLSAMVARDILRRFPS